MLHATQLIDDCKLRCDINDIKKAVLRWYNKGDVLIDGPVYVESGELQANIIPHSVAYGAIDMPYLTATQMTLVLSQSGYVLMGCMCNDPFYDSLSEEAYLLLQNNIPNGKCYILKQFWEFRKQIVKNRNILMKMTVTRSLITRTRIMLTCNLSINHDAAKCISTFYMPLKNM